MLVVVCIRSLSAIRLCQVSDLAFVCSKLCTRVPNRNPFFSYRRAYMRFQCLLTRSVYIRAPGKMNRGAVLGSRKVYCANGIFFTKTSTGVFAVFVSYVYVQHVGSAVPFFLICQFIVRLTAIKPSAY